MEPIRFSKKWPYLAVGCISRQAVHFFYNRTTYSCQWLSSLSLQNLILDPKVKGDTNILWQWTLIAWQRGARCNNTATRLSDPSFHHFSSYHWKHKLLEKGVPFLNPFLWCMHLHRVNKTMCLWLFKEKGKGRPTLAFAANCCKESFPKMVYDMIFTLLDLLLYWGSFDS